MNQLEIKEPVVLCIYDLLNKCPNNNCELVHLTHDIYKKFGNSLINNLLQVDGYTFTIGDDIYSCDRIRRYLEEINTGVLVNLYIVCVYLYLIEKNYKKVVEYCLIGVGNNNARVINILGSYYEEIEKHYEKAIEYFLMAAELNNESAIGNLGSYYDYIEKNYEKAIEYYSLAINVFGNVKAMMGLGKYYYFELKDYEKGAEYYLMAVNKGSNYAMYELARYYFNVKRDDALGISLCKRAIENETTEQVNRLDNYIFNIRCGSRQAARRLGNYYCILKDYELSVKYNLIAAENFDYEAMEQVAYYYETVEKNQEKAIEYYTRAVSIGSSKSLCNLVEYYNSVQNSEKVLEYLLLSLKSKDSWAMANLGNYYNSTVIDVEKSIYYYEMAVDNGYYEAADRLGHHYWVWGDFEKAAKIYEIGVNGGCPHAMNSLGAYFHVKRSDYKLATKYCYMAIKKGCYEQWGLFCDAVARSQELDKLINACLLAKKDEQLIIDLSGDLSVELKFKPKEKTIMRLLEYFACNTNNKILSFVLVSTCVSKRSQIFVEHFKYHPDSLTSVRLKEHFEKASKYVLDKFVTGDTRNEVEIYDVNEVVVVSDPLLTKTVDDKIDELVVEGSIQKLLIFLICPDETDYYLSFSHISQTSFNKLIEYFSRTCSGSILSKIIYYTENEEIDLNEIDVRYSLSTPDVCNVAINDFYLSISKKIIESINEDQKENVE